MFFVAVNTEICNFADDTTPNSSEENLKEALTNVEHDCAILVEWFVDNFMTLKRSIFQWSRQNDMQKSFTKTNNWYIKESCY